MAGILPGVEYARRRRFHQSGGNSSDNGGGGRRSTLCLYTSNHDNGSSHSSITTWQRSIKNLQAYDDHRNLGGVARQAKERLDEKLKLQRKLSDSNKPKRQDTSSGTLRMVDAGTMESSGELQIQVMRAKWWKWGMKLRLKSRVAEQEECPICIDGLKVEDNVVHLPCAHKFHTKCLLPWLLTNAHCPCCRMVIHIN